MSKAFLSHSSHEKELVKRVADKLGIFHVTLDQYDFHPGEKNISEIEKGIRRSDIFVLFISESALQSPWVEKEIEIVKSMISQNQTKKFLPFIVDDKVKIDNPKIPKWIVEAYNLKNITSSNKIAELIRMQIRECDWDKNPTNAQLSNLFVGRNDLISLLENNLSDIDFQHKNCIQLSGLEGIGRRSIINHYYKKDQIYSSASYTPPTIVLDKGTSIEDFITRLLNLGLLNCRKDISSLSCMKMQDKIDMLVDLLTELTRAKEFLFVLDNRSIVLPTGEIVEWFDKLLQQLESHNDVQFVLISLSKITPKTARLHQNLFTLPVPELNKSDCKNLFKRILKIKGIPLSEDEQSYIIPQFKGFPSQIFYAIQIIETEGVKILKDDPNLLIQYNTKKAALLLKDFKGNDKFMQVITLLSMSEFISFEFLESIFGSDIEYKQIIDAMITNAFVNFIGVKKEYIRLNTIFMDYIQRLGLDLNKEIISKIRNHTLDIIKKDSFGVYDDITSYNFVAKLTIKDDYQHIDVRKLLPSHILAAIRELYNKDRNHDAVCTLAYTLLENYTSLDPEILRETRYWLCLSLIRNRDYDRFWVEIKAFKFNDKAEKFLKGFYYRLDGNYIQALKMYTEALRIDPNFTRAKNEIVMIHLYLDEYDKALDLAENCINLQPSNPYFIINYFRCIVKKFGLGEKEKLEQLLSSLSEIDSDMARDACIVARSQYLTLSGEKEDALAILTEATHGSKSKILHLQLLDLLLSNRNKGGYKQKINEEISIIDKTFPNNREIKVNHVYLKAKALVSHNIDIVSNSIGKSITQKQFSDIKDGMSAQ